MTKLLYEMNEEVVEIIDAVRKAGPDGFLWCQVDVGDVILWPDYMSSVNDDGVNAVGRWSVSEDSVKVLMSLELVDMTN